MDKSFKPYICPPEFLESEKGAKREIDNLICTKILEKKRKENRSTKPNLQISISM